MSSADDNVQSAKNELALALLQMNDMFEPMLDSAAGQRKKLEAQGWSPTAAEAIALEQLLGMIRMTFAQHMGGKK